MSDKPLTPEERAWKLWEEYQELCKQGSQGNFPSDDDEAALFAKHIAAAVADARKDERARIIATITQYIDDCRLYEDVRSLDVAEYIVQEIQQEPTQ